MCPKRLGKQIPLTFKGVQSQTTKTKGRLREDKDRPLLSGWEGAINQRTDLHRCIALTQPVNRVVKA